MQCSNWMSKDELDGMRMIKRAPKISCRVYFASVLLELSCGLW